MRLISQLLIFTTGLTLTYHCPEAETVHAIASQSYAIDSTANLSTPISACILPDNSFVSSSGGGIFVRTSAGAEWNQRIPCTAKSSDWWEDCYQRSEFETVYSPATIWALPESPSVLIFDAHCGCFMTFDPAKNSNAALPWRRENYQPYVFHAALQTNFLICNIVKDSKILTVQKVNDAREFTRIFKPSPSVAGRLDSVGADADLGIPAFNPHDSTIWLNINGYRYIYVLNLSGSIIDSIAISSVDWVAPSPPVSRIRSMAVWRDWESRWTPTVVFRYIPPGYFMLQYRTGWKSAASDSIPLYSTAIWDTAGTSVSLDLDPTWQLAGVQPGGSLVFGHYECNGSECSVVLDIARIIP